MTDDEAREQAMLCATKMRAMAGEYRQLGFKALAHQLKEQADAALRWASTAHPEMNEPAATPAPAQP